jgi:hypothetical protein
MRKDEPVALNVWWAEQLSAWVGPSGGGKTR